MKKAPATIIAAAGMAAGLLGFAIPASAGTHVQDFTSSAYSRTEAHSGYINCFSVAQRDRGGYVEDSQHNRYAEGRNGQYTEYNREGGYVGEGSYREERRGSYAEFYVVSIHERAPRSGYGEGDHHSGGGYGHGDHGHGDHGHGDHGHGDHGHGDHGHGDHGHGDHGHGDHGHGDHGHGHGCGCDS